MSEVIEIIRLTAYQGGLLSVAFASAFIYEWYCCIEGWRGNKSTSFVPLLGGIFGCSAIIASGIPESRNFWWIPFIITPDSFLMIANGIYLTFRKNMRMSKK